MKSLIQQLGDVIIGPNLDLQDHLNIMLLVGNDFSYSNNK